MTNDATEILFRPLTLGNLKLANRIVMAPMTRGFAPGGVPGEAIAEYYRKRAEGGVGLILSEGTAIDRPASRNEPGIPFFYGEEALDGWKGIIDAVHGAGGLMGPQLFHSGPVASHSGWQPDAPVESPSGLLAPGTPGGVKMSEEDVADTIAAYAQAASDAKRLGFDVIEIHAAHGYLMDHFFWDGTNHRDDRYGGKTIGERSRFAKEIVAAVRQSVGPDLPVILRVSQWKQQDFKAKLAETPEKMVEWLQPLVEAGANVLHCSQRRFWEPEFPEIDGENGLNFAGWAKKLTGATTISVGSVGLSGDFLAAFSGESAGTAGLDQLIKRMENDEFDLIAVGRALISDASWANKVRSKKYGELRGFDASALAELA